MAHERAERFELAGVAASRIRAIRQNGKARGDFTPGASKNTMTSDMFSGTFTDENHCGNGETQTEITRYTCINRD